MAQDSGEGLAPRAAAVAVLGAVLTEGRLLAQVLADADGPLARLSPQERARAQRLASAVLRQLDPVDRLLGAHLRKNPPRAALDAMRLAVVEMSLGTPAHAAVNAAVSIVRRNPKTTHVAGLVNAVLRKVDPEALASQPPQHLPRWLRQPLVHRWGREVVAAIEAVHAKTPPTDLTLRAMAGGVPDGLTLPTGSLRLPDGGQISALPGYDAGAWWVQDAAAALAVPLLAPQSGERVLDLCAAPGGKTLQLAARGAQVTAVDSQASRVVRLRENLARTGLTAQVIVADALEWAPAQPFDAIVLDAPCSATGTIRRHPDLPFVKDGAELPALVALQAALLDRALRWLAPGGRLVFCTCSLLADEGEDQITAALARHPGLRVDPSPLPGVPDAWWIAGLGLRLRPDYWADLGGMDGFFMTRLRF